MHIKYDRRADALYVKFKDKKVSKTVEFSDTFLVDVDKKKEIIGIEILNYSKSAPKARGRFSVSTGRNKIPIPA